MAHILVIDDQLHIRSILKEFLKIDKHEVDLAENGKVGMQLAEHNIYDLVITDVVMPERDGLEVIMSLRRIFPHVRIIVMSGGTARLDIANLLKAAKALGADRVLAKPLDFIELQGVVRELLTLKK